MADLTLAFRRLVLGVAGLIFSIATPVFAQEKLEPGKEFGSWTVKCEDLTGGGRQDCYIFQNLKAESKAGTWYMQVAIGKAGDADIALAAFTFPLGTFLPPGLLFRVDQNQPFRLPVTRCLPNGCVALFPLEKQYLTQMKKGLNAEIIVHEDAEQPAKLQMSLKGFTAGIDAVLSQ